MMSEGMDRRRFLEVTAAGGLSVALVGRAEGRQGGVAVGGTRRPRGRCARC